MEERVQEFLKKIKATQASIVIPKSELKKLIKTGAINNPPRVGPLCSDKTKMHPILAQTGDKESHSIHSICPSCGISLWNHGEAVQKGGIQ